MARAKAKAPDLAALVAKASKSAPTDRLATALGALVVNRLAKPKAQSWDGVTMRSPSASAPKPRRTPMRRGKVIRYTTEGCKFNDARYGTYRHYMLATIMAHTDSRAAELKHLECEDSRYKGKNLDFAWAAANGYIKLI